jgi:dihydroorotase
MSFAIADLKKVRRDAGLWVLMTLVVSVRPLCFAEFGRLAYLCNKTFIMSVIFKNARVINPAQKLNDILHVSLSDGGVIQQLEKDFSAVSISPADTVHDFTRKIIAAGFFDMHCHFREPGFGYKETIETGVRSAIAGGYTGVALMPNTTPPTDSGIVVSYLREKAKGKAVDVVPIGCITQGRKGEKIASLMELHAAGVTALSDDGSPVMNAQVMRLAFEYASMSGQLIIQHCEDLHLAAQGVMNEGVASLLLGMHGVPSVSESIMAGRDLSLMKYLGGCRYHVAHISTAEAVNLIRTAKREGLAATCEVTPHHFSLSDRDVLNAMCNGHLSYDGNLRMNPPLRGETDKAAILEAIADGTIDCIATDHAPHALHEKECGFSQAAFGIVGLETAIGLGMTNLVHQKIISIDRFVEMSSTLPRRLMQLADIQIATGQPANFTLIDPDARWTVDTGNLKSKSKNSPFHNYKLVGKPLGIVNHGQILLA